MSGTSDVTVRWTPETSGRAAAVQIRSRIVGDTKWTEQATGADPAAGEFRLTGVQPDANIEVQTRVRMTSGTYGPWTDNTVHTDAFTVAYGSVTGTPTSLGQINSVEAGKLSGIQAGATVGAPAGTYVGGVLAQDVASVVTNYQASSGTNTTPPAVPTGLALASNLEPDGAHATVTIAWAPVGDADLSVYQLQVAENGGAFVDVTSGSATEFRLAGRLPGTAITARVRAVDRAGNASGWSAVASHTVVLDTTAPTPPTNVRSSAGLSSILVSWLNPPDADLAGVVIYQSATNDVATATAMTTLRALPGQGGSYSWAGLPSGYSRYIWLRAIDTSRNLSGWSNVTGATTARVDAADFQPGLSPTLTVASAAALPASTGSGRLAFVANEAKTYRDTSTGWRKDVDGADLVVGSIQSAAIATGSISASKIAVRADNLNPDPLYQDTSMYHQVVGDTTTTSFGSSMGDFSDHGRGWYPQADNDVAGRVGTSRAMTLYVPAVQNSAWRYHLYQEPWSTIPLVGGKSYEYSASAFNQTSQTILIQLDAFGQDGGYKTSWNFPVYAGQSGTFTGTFTAPMGVTACRTLLYNHGGIWGAPALTGTVAHVSNFQVREQLGGTMVVDGSITTRHLIVGDLDGDRIKTNTLAASAIKSTDSLPGSLSISNTGFSLSTLASTASAANSAAGTAQGRANDAYGLAGTANTNAGNAQGTADAAKSLALNPAAQVNSASTLIDPGKIQLQGATTLRNWMTGGDSTEIRGSAISAGSIAVNQGTFGNRNIQVNGLDFHYDQSSNSLVWSVGDVTYVNDAGNNNDGFGLNGGSCAYNGGVYYLWINRNNPTVYCSQTNNVGNPDDFQIGRWYGGQNYNITFGRTLVSNDHVQTSSLQADRLVSYSITSQQLATSNLITSSAQVGDGVITNAKIGNLEVDSAKIANLTVGTNKITGNAVTVGDFVSSSSSWQGGGGVSSGTSYYTVDGVTY